MISIPEDCEEAVVTNLIPETSKTKNFISNESLALKDPQLKFKAMKFWSNSLLLRPCRGGIILNLNLIIFSSVIGIYSWQHNPRDFKRLLKASSKQGREKRLSQVHKSSARGENIFLFHAALPIYTYTHFLFAPSLSDAKMSHLSFIFFPLSSFRLVARFKITNGVVRSETQCWKPNKRKTGSFLEWHGRILCTHRGNNKLWNNIKKNNFS